MTITRLPSVAVNVEDSGKVWVNGQLVAEVTADQVAGRDELEHSLALHRIATIVHTTLRDCRNALDKVDKEADRHLIGEGVADGFDDVRDTTLLGAMLPSAPRRHEREYRVGLQVGGMLAAMLTHLDREDAE